MSALSGHATKGERQGEWLRQADLARLSIAACLTLAIMGMIAMAPRWIAVPSDRLWVQELGPMPLGMQAGDGRAYLDIASGGYGGDGHSRLRHVFFPMWPFCLATISAISQVDTSFAAVIGIVAGWLTLVWLFQKYVEDRAPGATSVAAWTLLLFPATFFFRSAYSETLFCVLEVMFLIGISKRWPIHYLTGIASCAVLTRPVGIALVLVLLWRTWRETKRRERWHDIGWILASATVAVGGFAWLQWSQTGDPFAFLFGQGAWQCRWDGAGAWCLRSLTFEPLACSYISGTPGYWGNFAPWNALLNYQFWNPILWCVMVFCLIHGWRRRWLTSDEVLLAALLIAIPYLLQAYRTCFLSQARYAAVALPCYLVAAREISSWPLGARIWLLVPSVILLTVFALQLGAGYYVV